MSPKTFFLTEISGPQEGLNLPRSWNPGSWIPPRGYPYQEGARLFPHLTSHPGSTLYLYSERRTRKARNLDVRR
jgi:hypothetical protein